MQASFHVDGLPDPHYGEVVRINPVAVAGTRRVTFYIRVMNPDHTLKIGQFAKGDIVLRQISEQIVLPLPAIRDPDGQPWVLVVLNGRVERRPVMVLLRSESNQLAAGSGVNAGEQVIAAARAAFSGLAGAFFLRGANLRALARSRFQRTPLPP